MTHDFTRKGGVVLRDILLPDHAPAEYRDRATLWNAVEKIEKAKNSQLAREIEIAIPAELNFLQQTNLIREYVRRTFVDKGMCADICIHDKNDGNPHAHVMLTMRPINEDGTWGDKQKKEYILDSDGNKIYDQKKRQYKCKSIPATDWNEQTKAEEWRAAWADTANRYLEAGRGASTNCPLGRRGLPDGEARNPHRPGKYQPRNRSHQFADTATPGANQQAARLAQRCRKHQASHL